ncbi:MAG: hypothetical protein ACRD8Z_11385 [Nitrososphaeraceae archaeon]
MSFFIEIALAKARKGDSEIQIKNKQGLFEALTDRDTFIKILEQADDVLKSTEYCKQISASQDSDYIINYLMRIRDKIDLGRAKILLK